MKQQRLQMVQKQLVDRGIADVRVLDALKTVPRHKFIPEPFRDVAYTDGPLPIGHNQTISQPYIVAFMTELLNIESHHTILEIGTGCGYQTAILSCLAKKIISVEVVPELSESSMNRLSSLGYKNIEVHCSDGSEGWEQNAPYQRIMVTASPKSIPEALLDQLDIDGRMIIPVGKSVFRQELKIVTKNKKGHIDIRPSLPVRFVPLVT